MKLKEPVNQQPWSIVSNDIKKHINDFIANDSIKANRAFFEKANVYGVYYNVYRLIYEESVGQ